MIWPARTISLGTVDFYLVSHHGKETSSLPMLVHAMHPRAAVMNNGAHKGAEPPRSRRSRLPPVLKTSGSCTTGGSRGASMRPKSSSPIWRWAARRIPGSRTRESQLHQDDGDARRELHAHQCPQRISQGIRAAPVAVRAALEGLARRACRGPDVLYFLSERKRLVRRQIW